MKILYLNADRGIPVCGDKGASVHVRAFISAAAALGHEVLLVCASLGSGNASPPARIVELPVLTDRALLRRECALRGLPERILVDDIVRRELARLAYDRALPAQVSALLARENFIPDVVYERHALFHQAGVEIAARLGVARLLEVNAPLIEEQARFRGLSLRGLAQAAELASYQGAASVIAVSEAVAAHVRGVAGPGVPVNVVPNGVDLARFGQRGAGAGIREKLGIGAGPVIGFIGSFKPWHGMGFLLDAVAAQGAGLAALRILAVGDGPDLAALRERAAEPGFVGRVILPGRVAHADIPGWLAAMDITVAPYLDQPDFYFSPLKIVESLAAGKPVVAPRIGQIPQLVQHGETGLLYEPGDIAGCGAALARLVADPQGCARMGEKAQSAAAGWDWRALVGRILATARQPVCA
ncbi:MAG: glycosyl transferase family 1 [Acidocella sp. 20-63-7]|nr:MAG: glycosyl transferase family 1 [Acidocella sp. 20-63-7]HQT45815.1 glycosyltransferase family 4 protein [Acidocella sp.]